MKFLIQQGVGGLSHKEVFACEAYPHLKTAYSTLSNSVDIEYCPVGSVEFVDKFCKLNNIVLPDNISYPTELREFLKRKVWQSTFSEAEPFNFVKPVSTKVFTGTIKSLLEEDIQADCPVWVSEPVQFDAEFRCYIIDRTIVGYSRYDDSDTECDLDTDTVNKMIAQYSSQPAGYSIDVGIVNGETVLVEVNDGWSLGLYLWGTMTKDLYPQLLYKRWTQILQENNK